MDEPRCIHGVPITRRCPSCAAWSGAWTTSSYCAQSDCVQARPDGATVQVRDARCGPTVIVPVSEWRAFIARIRDRQREAVGGDR